MSNDGMWKTDYVDDTLPKCLKSIANSLRILSHRKVKGQSSFNSKFYAIYRHYLKYVQYHPWYTRKLSVIDFYCRILNIAYKCDLTNPKLVIQCKQDYLHIKNEYDNAQKYLQYLSNLDQWRARNSIYRGYIHHGYKKEPQFSGTLPSRKFLVRLQYDPTTNMIESASGDYIHSALTDGLHYRAVKGNSPIDYIANRRTFFAGECRNGYPANANSFSLNIINPSYTPYSTNNKIDYLTRIKEGDKNE